ncbi:GPI anchored serine-threonine rich family protein [Aspergillus undulatus]|uniref:GPI anchored serine-threonine rich family protein n=1 Tax=Aspergillus undulatus TaxID=1810928 RepID=UPI003CCD7885
MRSMLFVALSAIATLVAARENPFNIPTNGYEFTAGESTTLNWDPTTEGTVTLKLQWGSAAFTSSTGTTIVSNIPNSGSYTWDVPSDITDHSDYTVEIISDSDPESSNYLPRFSVEGAEAATTTATSTTTTETTTTEETTTTTETSSTSTHTTLTTTTTTTTESSETPSPIGSSSYRVWPCFVGLAVRSLRFCVSFEHFHFVCPYAEMRMDCITFFYSSFQAFSGNDLDCAASESCGSLL